MDKDLFYNMYNYHDIKADDVVVFDIELQLSFTKIEEILLGKVFRNNKCS